MAMSAEWIRDDFARMEFELEQWGRWVRSGAPMLGVGPQALGMMRGSTVPSPQISDDRALEIDRAMQRLERFDVQLWSAIRYTYCDGVKPYKWCRWLGVNKHVAYYRLLPNAVRWMVSEISVSGV